MLAILRSTGFKVFGAIGLICLATLVYADTHMAKTSEHTLNHGKKWETTEAMRQGMDNIRQVMSASQGGIEKEQLSAQDYQRLAETVDKNVADILKNGNLAITTSKAFHVVVLADLTQSTELMRTSPKVQTQRVAAMGVLHSLRNYGEYFQHPGWLLGVVNSR